MGGENRIQAITGGSLSECEGDIIIRIPVTEARVMGGALLALATNDRHAFTTGRRDPITSLRDLADLLAWVEPYNGESGVLRKTATRLSV